MTAVRAYAKINLALVVGERRSYGLHELATVLQRVDLADSIELREAGELRIGGYADDTLVRQALTRLADAAGVRPRWDVRIGKRIPVAAGLGGGSADAGAALVLANRTLAEPIAPKRLAAVAAAVGADVPFFLERGPKLAEGAGERLTALELPQDFWAAILLPPAVRKRSTAEVYRRYDELGQGVGFAERREALVAALGRCGRARDLAALPPNDLARAGDASPLLAELRSGGAFRADMSGAGPALYGLFEDRAAAVAAARRVGEEARVWITAPVW